MGGNGAERKPRTAEGERLREVREKLGGWSGRRLAGELGVSPSQISRWESGAIRKIPAGVMRQAEQLLQEHQSELEQEVAELRRRVARLERLFPALLEEKGVRDRPS